jgi:uncharacterized alkaline shock family protein YloU
MTDIPNPIPDPAASTLDVNAPAAEVLSWEPQDLDGFTIDDLMDYLDTGMTPPNPVIDVSPSCQIALVALQRVRTMTQTLLDEDALDAPPIDDSWVAGILENITLESRAGRDIPFHAPNVRAELVITEGAVRGIVRAAGDTVQGILVGRCVLDGDVTIPNTPITVQIDATIIFGASIPETTERIREAIRTQLLTNTELNVAAVDITVTDVHVAPTPTRPITVAKS